MKKFYQISIVLTALIMLQLGLSAKTDNEKKLMKKATELTYEGQLKHAQELMSREAKTKTASTGDGEEWDGNLMFLSMFWGAIGAGFFLYGKRQGNAAYLLCGIGLMAFPYFISSIMVSIISGVVLCVIPFKVSI